MNPPLTAAMLFVAGSIFCFTMLRRLLPLRALRHEARHDRPIERLAALLRFGFGQRRLVDREELVPGLLHILVFVAFLVLALRAITLFGMGFVEDFHLPFLTPGSMTGRAYTTLKDLTVFGGLAACFGFLYRRLVSRPARVTRSSEGIVILLLIVAVLVSDLAFDCSERTSLVRTIAFWGHLTLILVFGNLLPYGKHFHVFTALFNVYWQRLPPEGVPASSTAHTAALRRLDLEREDPECGCRSVNDLSWKEALDVYSCTECGRCETHCPTAVTGKPLSHKEVNRTLRRHLADESAALIRRSTEMSPIVNIVSPDAFWACTTCGWCETACPVFIENTPRLIDMRRHQVLAESSFPEEATRIFKGIETQGNPWGIGSNRRTEWCEDLDIPRATETRDWEVLFFVGCAGAFDDRQKKVSRAIVQILRAAGVEFAILGEEETCNGEAARRLGNEYLFQQQAAANVEKLKACGAKKVLVQCPHCYNTFRNEFPQFGGDFDVVHHSELIADLLSQGRIRPDRAVERSLVFHDPCYLSRHNGITEPPRDVLSAVPGASLLEMARNRRLGFCCGAGGGRFWLDEKLGTRINQERVREAASTLGDAGGTIATGCPFCLTMLEDGVNELGCQEKLDVLDVAEVFAEGLGPADRP
jgi:Fe-S oxidoreductase